MCARTFTSIVRSQTLSGVSSPVPWATPALAQNRSTGPNSSSARSMSVATSPSSDTSQPMPRPASPISRATNCAPVSSMSATTTPCAPSCAKRRAMARPMPEAPPVTTATRFARSTDAQTNGAAAGTPHRWKNGPMPEDDDGRRARFVEALKRFDAHPRLIKAAQAARGILPGDRSYGDPLSVAGNEPPQLIGQRLTTLTNDRLSAIRELGLSTLQVCQELYYVHGPVR